MNIVYYIVGMFWDCANIIVKYLKSIRYEIKQWEDLI